MQIYFEDFSEGKTNGSAEKSFPSWGNKVVAVGETEQRKSFEGYHN
jgi:hypothetical protein